MTEVDIPKRVVVVLLFLVILISFLGTLTVLQLYATAPRPVNDDQDVATIRLGILPSVGGTRYSNQADDTATISLKINKMDG